MVTQRLDRILSNFGYGSRKEVKELIKGRCILVDGIPAKDSGMHVDPAISSVEINGERLAYREYVYIMMNKPAGVISATYDPRKKTALDLLPDKYKCFELFPAGRLDLDTEGFLLLTNDGQLAHNLLSPKKHVGKKYFARVEGMVGRTDVESFKAGITLDDGYLTMPADLTVLKEGSISDVEVVLKEGKFHQVKRMFQAVGKIVVYLKRIEMGGLKLDEALGLGECRELTEDELESLKNKGV